MARQKAFKVGDRFEHPHKWQGVVLSIQPMYSPYSSRTQKSFLVLDDKDEQHTLINMVPDEYLKHLGKYEGPPLPNVSACPLCKRHYAWRKEDPGECRVCARLGKDA